MAGKWQLKQKKGAQAYITYAKRFHAHAVKLRSTPDILAKYLAANDVPGDLGATYKTARSNYPAGARNIQHGQHVAHSAPSKPLNLRPRS